VQPASAARGLRGGQNLVADAVLDRAEARHAAAGGA
jgi:hypothetical protein